MIYIIILAHWIADFICQTNWMAQNKSKSYKALSLHILSLAIEGFDCTLYLEANELVDLKRIIDKRVG